MVDSRSRSGANAEMMNYTVVFESSGVLATHITEVVKAHAHELLTREEVGALHQNSY